MATEFNSSSKSYLCFTQARCRLCQFPVHGGDVVFAAVEDGFDTELELPHVGNVWDRELRITFHTCFSKECSRRDEPTVCYHVDCYRIRLYKVTPIFLTATEYSFTPSLEEEQRRAEYIRQTLACKLEQMGFVSQSLPYELWLMVARHLVRQCAVHMAENQVRAADEVGDSVLDLTQSVFASYIKIDGRYYIKRLQNTPDSSSGSRCCLLLPAQNLREKDMNIFVAEDHIGIRRVVFVSPKKLEEWCRRQSSIPGAWWKHLSQGAMPSTVTIKGDGLKARCIENSQIEDLALVSWPTPLSSPPVIVNLATLEAPCDHPDGLRMDFFDCNEPDIVGYSVAFMDSRLVGVVSHRKGEYNQGVYEKAGPTGCYWQYMPMNEGEYLTDICRVAGSWLPPRLEILNCVPGMTFITNRDRTVFFGIYGYKNDSYRRVWKLSRESYRVYYNDRDGYFHRHIVDLVGAQHTINHPAKISQDNLPAPVVSISDFERIPPNTLRYYSSCSMQHVTEVQTCGFGAGSSQEILGMLLHYADGHRECVGYFRHDRVIETIPVGGGDSLYFRIKQIEKTCSYAFITMVTCQAPVDQATGSWLQVTQSGILEWWHSAEGTALYYNGLRLGVVYHRYM